MTKAWQLIEPSVDLADPAYANFSPLVTRLLANRGLVDAAEIEQFLHPNYQEHIHDPFAFDGMARVVERIERAIASQESIVVYADYDADGICSAATLTSTLKALGANVTETYLPHRETEGYGLNLAAVDRFVAAQTRLLITLDCGTTSVTEIQRAKEGGIDVIVVDHHHVPEVVPPTYALLNAKKPGETYPYHFLATGGMAFKVAQALFRSRLQQKPDEAVRWESFEKWLLDLVAIPTVTDLVPLTGENRTLLTFGLKVLNKTRRPGLLALIKAMGSELGELDAATIGFQIGPRINAAGRMNHGSVALDLLLTDDNVIAKKLATELNESNQERQQLTEHITREAREQAEAQLKEGHPVLVAVGDNWPVGIVGLVAGRLLEVFHRPILVIGRSEQGISGSGRSIQQFNMIEALHTMPQLFTKFGGHAQACGFTLRSEEQLLELMRQLRALAATLTEEQLRPVINVDVEISLDEVQQELLETIEQFEPFGMANPRPKFLIRGARLTGFSTVGKSGKHLKFTVSSEAGTIRQVIAFNRADLVPSFVLGQPLDLVVEISENQWNGHSEIQLKLLDLHFA